jgi:flagellar assembly factor FliW
VKITSARFGDIELPDDVLIHFEKGLLGLEESTTSLVLLEQEDSPYYWLQSADDPDVAFVVTDPWLFWPDYDVLIPDEVEEELDLKGPEEVEIMVLVSVRPAEDSEYPEVTANLLGPLVVNSRTRHGCQLVLDDSEYSTRTQMAA